MLNKTSKSCVFYVYNFLKSVYKKTIKLFYFLVVVCKFIFYTNLIQTICTINIYIFNLFFISFYTLSTILIITIKENILFITIKENTL